MGGGAAKAQAKADKNAAKIEMRKQGIAKDLDKFEEGITNLQRPMKERALEAYANAGKVKGELGQLEVKSAKDTTGILQAYKNSTDKVYNERQQGLFNVLNKPQFDPQTITRISSRMAKLDQLFEME